MESGGTNKNIVFSNRKFFTEKLTIIIALLKKFLTVEIYIEKIKLQSTILLKNKQKGTTIKSDVSIMYHNESQVPNFRMKPIPPFNHCVIFTIFGCVLHFL